MKNDFFKPSKLYKEFQILDLIEKNKVKTQRDISREISSTVSMVNNYLNEYEIKGFIKKKYCSTKTVKYSVTKKGTERRKLLNIWYLKSSQNVYKSAKDNIIEFLRQITNKGFKKILLYGAGEVAEIILDVINSNNDLSVEVLSIIDDSLDKINKQIHSTPIISLEEMRLQDEDGILISSYIHHETIKQILLNHNYPKSKIIDFFS